MDPKLLWYTIAHPSLAWEEEFFVRKKIVIYNDVGGDHHGGAHGRGDGQCPPCWHRGGGHLHRGSLQCLPLLLPRLAAIERLHAYRRGRCCCRRRPDGRWSAVIRDDSWAPSQPWGRCPWGLRGRQGCAPGVWRLPGGAAAAVFSAQRLPGDQRVRTGGPAKLFISQRSTAG
jgi:hypothetical protein